MREFFRGWRRKVGCVTLVMACVCIALWFRTGSTSDVFALRIHGRAKIVVELTAGVAVLSYDWLGDGILQGVLIQDNFFNWGKYPSLGDKFRFLPDAGKSDWAEHGFMAGWLAGEKVYVMVPLLTITILLTLVSAYLLLWRPRKRTGVDHA